MLRYIAVPFAVAATLCLQTGCSESVASRSSNTERGRYLVENVAMCADCHSPRGPDGAFVQDKWLQGTQLGFAPLMPMPVWSDFAPSLAGLNHYSDAELTSLLTQGHFTDGRQLRPPMPPFRFSEEDARDVIAFLRSLHPDPAAGSY